MIEYKDNIEIGNGDPVLVYSDRHGAMSLGTGFESLEDLEAQIQRAIETGNGSIKMPPEVASKLSEVSGVEVFLPVGRIE